MLDVKKFTIKNKEFGFYVLKIYSNSCAYLI